MTTRARARFSKQLLRAIAIAEATRKRPMGLVELSKYVNERTKGNVCQRTIRRDVNALVELGYVVVNNKKYSARGRI